MRNTARPIVCGILVPNVLLSLLPSLLLSVLLGMLLGVLLGACRDRPRYVGPEHLILDVELGPEVVQQTVTGMVRCPNCAPNETTMLVDLYLPSRTSPEPLATVGFDQLGAYSITATVPYGELLEIRVTLFTAGGVKKTSARTQATDDKDLDESTVTLDLEI